MKPLNVRDLVQRARSHEEEAVVALIERCESRIAGAIVIAGVPRFDSDFEDAQNLALFEIWKQFPKLKQSGSVCSWMHGIARRVTASRIIDQNSRHRRRATKLAATSTRQTAVAESPENRVADLDLLGQVLQELSTQHREVLLLRYLEGFSEAETAQLLGIGIKTVSSRTTRAKRAAMDIVKRLEAGQ